MNWEMAAKLYRNWNLLLERLHRGKKTREANEGVLALVRELAEEDIVDAGTAVGKLAKMGKPAVRPLINVLQDPDSNYCEYAAEALGWIKDRRAVMPLILAVKREDGPVNIAAINALGFIKDRRAVRTLIDRVENKSENVSGIRWRAVQALGRIGDRRAVKPLIGLLEDKDVEVRAEAAKALGDIGDRAAVEPLTKLLRDADGEARAFAIYGIGKILKTDATGLLIENLNSFEGGRYAAYVLAEMGILAIEPLIKSFGRWHAESYGHTYAVRTLVGIGEPAVGPVHRAAAEGRMKYEDAREVLEKMREEFTTKQRRPEKGIVRRSVRPEEILCAISRIRPFDVGRTMVPMRVR